MTETITEVSTDITVPESPKLQPVPLPLPRYAPRTGKVQVQDLGADHVSVPARALSFEETNAFLQTVQNVVQPMLQSLEYRLRAEFQSAGGAVAMRPSSAQTPSPPGPVPVIYKTPVWVYVGLTMALLLSLIAVSR